MKKNSLIKSGIIFLSITLFFMLCSSNPSTATELKTLMFSTQSETEALDPVQGVAIESLNAIGSFYDTLITFKGGGTELAPCLAESWEISKDGKSITFHLRKGVKFHDGTELTADDVKYTLERVLKTKLHHSIKFSKILSVDGLIVVNKYTFLLRIKRPTLRIFPMLTYTMGAGIVSRDYVKKHSTEGDPYGLNWMRNHEMGTGPWKLEKWLVNEKLTKSRNDEYWGDKPHFDRMIINVISDPATAQMMLERGDLDIATRLTIDQYAALEKVKGVVVKDYPTLKTVYTRINCSKKPFDDVRVRQALNYAINYDELIKYVEKGKAFRLYTTLPRGVLGWNPDVKPKYTYDPEKAKSLLEEAGLAKGFEVTLLYSPGRYAQFEDMVPYIISYLANIGIKAKAQKLAYSTQIAEMKKREYDLALDTWTPFYPDPSSTALYYYLSSIWKGRGWSFAFWENKRLDELITIGDDNLDIEKRAEQYQEADQIAVENAIAVPFYQVKEPVAMRDNIKNLEWHPTLLYKKFMSVYRKPHSVK